MSKSRGADLLRARLQELGWTQAELAARLGVTPAPVCRWLSGQGYPSLALAVRIERATGVPMEAWTPVQSIRR